MAKQWKILRKRVKVRLVNNAKDYKKYVSKPSFVSQKIFSKTFATIYEIKPVLTLDKPLSVGFGIWDLSKLLMYGFYYKYIQVKCEIVYEIKTDDVYEDFYENKNLFDFSDD